MLFYYRLLPIDALDLLSDFLGGSQSMDEFVGRNQETKKSS